MASKTKSAKYASSSSREPVKRQSVQYYHPIMTSKSTQSGSTLSFPPPHQLGISSGIQLSRSSRSFINADSGEQIRKLNYSSKSAPFGFDETDFACPPPPKKSAVASGRSDKGRSSKRKKQVVESIVETYDKSPLKEFSLFLPPRLPMSILRSHSALQEFVHSTASTYVSLWKLESKMDIVELRFPSFYVEQLSENGDFLKAFLSSILEQLEGVKHIKEFYLPKIVLHAHTSLEKIFEALLGRKGLVSQLYIPIKSSLQSKELEKIDYKSLAAFLRKLNCDEITFISSDDVIVEFSDKISTEVKKVKKNTLVVHYSSQELDAPGPHYIAELDQKPVIGESVDPHLLVESMNVNAEAEERQKAKSSRKLGARKDKAHGAFSTDCTYSDEAELSSDGPFVSEIWNLERLHDEGIDGTGTTIAVIDSGINYTHPAFKGKIIAIKNFVEEEIDNMDCAIDSDGHGTHCAGIAAANSFYCPLNSSDPDSACITIPPGVAPGAKLVVCKVVKTSNGDVDSPAFLNSLLWLKELHTSGRQKIDVISISLASTYYSHERAQVISELTSLGVIVACCASNVGRLRMQPIAFPARLGHVLCIGAHDENGKPTSFSPVGRELDFLSPGDNLWGPGPGTIGPFAMDCASGTSCATPAVAGLVSLILQAVDRIYKSDPEEFTIGEKPLIELIRNVWVMREILKEMSSSPGHHSEEIGYGTLNPYRILDRSNEEIMRIINEIIEDE